MNKKYISSVHEMPRFTKHGFLKVKCPQDIWPIIMDAYNIVRRFPSEPDHMGSTDDKKVEIFQLANISSIAQYIHESFHSLHEWWSGQELEPTALWGIRSYKNDVKLKMHHDRPHTHHISSIVMVDKDLNRKEDWPLVIKDFDGNYQHVYTEPGDIILYESIACEHGRPIPFQGNYFRNFYMHYKLKNYEYIGLGKDNEHLNYSDPGLMIE